MASIIAGLDKMVNQEIERLGTNLIFVTKFRPDVNHGDLSEEERNRDPITIEEAMAIKVMCPTVNGVAPMNYYFRPGGNVVKYKGRQANRPQIFGTLPDFEYVRNRYVDRGRFLNEFDVEHRSMVTVIGSDVAAALFPGEDPLDKEIRVNSRRFRVIGVVEEKPPFLGESDNNFVILPFSTFVKIHPWEEELSLAVSAISHEKLNQAIDEITATLRKVRGVPYDKPDNFAVFTQDNIRDQVGTITNTIYLVMIAISSVGLLVGGVGVMNIMLVSVTERTREIGVRKAVGARRNNILFQFLTEAMTLSGTGGVIGIGLGVMIAFATNVLFSLPFTISMPWLIIGFTVSIVVGLTAGVYPAYKAAKVDPIVSLHYE
jgi:putative ABC transport system permease protein